MKKEENLDGPIGWLKDPHNKWAIHFDYKNVSTDDIPNDFTIDMWGVMQNGKPMEFKSRRKASKQDSIKTWNQLIESNWVEFIFDKDKIA
tara:strand:- start:4943 stop:5212 length:270 start_codon:yes stop_codon:yes gene_type:complete